MMETRRATLGSTEVKAAAMGELAALAMLRAEGRQKREECVEHQGKKLERKQEVNSRRQGEAEDGSSPPPVFPGALPSSVWFPQRDPSRAGRADLPFKRGIWPDQSASVC